MSISIRTAVNSRKSPLDGDQFSSGDRRIPFRAMFQLTNTKNIIKLLICVLLLASVCNAGRRSASGRRSRSHKSISSRSESSRSRTKLSPMDKAAAARKEEEHRKNAVAEARQTLDAVREKLVRRETVEKYLKLFFKTDTSGNSSGEEITHKFLEAHWKTVQAALRGLQNENNVESMKPGGKFLGENLLKRISALGQKIDRAEQRRQWHLQSLRGQKTGRLKKIQEKIDSWEETVLKNKSKLNTELAKVVAKADVRDHEHTVGCYKADFESCKQHVKRLEKEHADLQSWYEVEIPKYE